MLGNNSKYILYIGAQIFQSYAKHQIFPFRFYSIYDRIYKYGAIKKCGRHGNDVIRMPRVPSFTSMHGLKAVLKKPAGATVSPSGWATENRHKTILLRHNKYTVLWNTVSVPSMALPVINEQITREGCV